MFAITISAVSIILYQLFNSFSSVINYDFYSGSESLDRLNNNLKSTYEEVNAYSNLAYGSMGNVSTSPEQTEGVDVISVLGRFGVVVVKTFISAFTIPVDIVNAIVNALGVSGSYSIIATFVVSIFTIMVVLEVLSIATRYPLDR